MAEAICRKTIVGASAHLSRATMPKLLGSLCLCSSTISKGASSCPILWTLLTQLVIQGCLWELSSVVR